MGREVLDVPSAPGLLQWGKVVEVFSGGRPDGEPKTGAPLSQVRWGPLASLCGARNRLAGVLDHLSCVSALAPYLHRCRGQETVFRRPERDDAPLFSTDLALVIPVPLYDLIEGGRVASDRARVPNRDIEARHAPYENFLHETWAESKSGRAAWRGLDCKDFHWEGARLRGGAIRLSGLSRALSHRKIGTLSGAQSSYRLHLEDLLSLRRQLRR